jgi:enoyl-CoA hydratase
MDEPSVRLAMDGPVAIIRMARGKANALDTAICRALAARLSEAERGGARAAVLTGHGSVFCAGVDLLSVTDAGPGYLDEFLPALTDAFLAVFACPIPVVAAVNGHAIAGGCILVSACDHRVMNAEHGRIGVTELLVGVPFPISALEILRFAAGTQRLHELIYHGRTYPAADALALGLVDETADEAAVMPVSVEIARQLAALPSEALRHTRGQIRGPVLERISRQRGTDETVHSLWASRATQEAIRAYAGRVLRRGRAS